MYFRKKIILAISVVLFLVSLPVSSLAKSKDKTKESRIEALESLAMEQGVSKQVLNGLLAQQRDRDGNDMRVYFKNGLRFDSRNKRFKYKIGGRIHLDVNFYGSDNKFKTSNFKGPSGKGDGDVSNGTELRRSRFFVSGLLYNRVKFKAEYDFLGDTSLKDVYVGLVKIPIIGNITVGHFREPFSLEAMTSAKYLPFMERSVSDLFAPGRNLGIAIHDTLFDGRATYAMGYFRPTSSTAPSIQSNNGGAFTTRLTAVPFQRAKGKQLLHLGFGYSFRTSDKKDGSETEKFNFSTTPESKQAPTTVGTGDIGGDELHEFNFETAIVYHFFRVQGEYTLITIKQFPGRPDIAYYGAYAMFSVFLTGENQNYSDGAFGRVAPKKNFMEKGGFGAVETAFRISTVDLNDSSADERGGREVNYAAALNWYLNAHSRVMFNYVRSSVYGDPGEDFGHLNTYAMRFQVDF